MEDWWLKFTRAEKHVVDIKEATLRYASGNPYSFTRIRQPDSQKEIRARFQITQQPDPMIALMLGDFVHNLRSALDYIIVACVPKQHRKHASFPIMYEDIFATGRDGQFVVKDACLRKNAITAIGGLHPKAQAFVISLQPYNSLNIGRNVNNHALGILSRLENADKHRQLTTVGCGGKDFSLSFTIRNIDKVFYYGRLLFPSSTTRFLKDNTIVPYTFPSDGIRFPNGSLVQPSDMEMHLSGTVKVMVEIPQIGGNQAPTSMMIDDIMSACLSDVRCILINLEFFVID